MQLFSYLYCSRFFFTGVNSRGRVPITVAAIKAIWPSPYILTGQRPHCQGYSTIYQYIGNNLKHIHFYSNVLFGKWLLCIFICQLTRYLKNKCHICYYVGRMHIYVITMRFSCTYYLWPKWNISVQVTYVACLAVMYAITPPSACGLHWLNMRFSLRPTTYKHICIQNFILPYTCNWPGSYMFSSSCFQKT